MSGCPTGNMRKPLREKWKACAGASVLTASLALSALVTAVALRSPTHHWLAWFSFMPLFAVIQWSRPTTAAFAGAFWGACLYLFHTIRLPATTLSMTSTGGSSASLLTLSIVIPMTYLAIAARPARAIGFRLLILAFGWTLFDAVAAPGPAAPDARTTAHAGHQVRDAANSPEHTRFSTPNGENQRVHWLAELLGRVSLALLVAGANASLVDILGNARLTLRTSQSLIGSINPVFRLPSQVAAAIQHHVGRQAHPRAPPESTRSYPETALSRGLQPARRHRTRRNSICQRVPPMGNPVWG